MDYIQKIAKNASFFLVGNLLSYIIGFFTIMYTARYLGAEGFGILSLAISLTGIFGIFADLGLSTLTVREVARNKSLSNKYMVNTAFIKIILSCLTFGLISLTVKEIGYPQTVINIIYLITFSMILVSFSGIFNSIFQAHEKMEYQSISIILNSILTFSGVMVIIYYKKDINFIAALYFITSIIILIYNILVYSWKFYIPKLEIDLNFWKPMLKEAWPFGITGVFVNIYYWIDSIILSIMVNNEVVGWYNGAYRLILVLLIVPVVLNAVIFPVMSKLYITSNNSLKITYQKYFQYMVIIGIPLGVGTTLLAKNIILFIFGDQYLPSAIALQILIWSTVIIYISGSFARLLEASNKQLVLTKITAICAVINIILNVLLIPKFSYIGASIVTVVTELINLILCIKVVSSSMNYKFSRNELEYLIKTGFSSIIMAISIICIKDFNFLFSILIAIIVYFTILYLVKGFKDEDIKLFKQIIGKKKRKS